MRQICFYLLLLISICICFIQCRRDPETLPPEGPGCQYEYSTDEQKKWYYFKYGTWWIYKEQNSGDMDTVTVYAHGSGDNWFDYYELHSYGDWTVNYWIHPTPAWVSPCGTHPNCDCGLIWRSRFKAGDFVGEAWAFDFPHIVGNYHYDLGPFERVKNTVVSIQDTMVLNDSTFYEVVHWDLPHDKSENNYTGIPYTNYWIAKNVGVIRQLNFDKNTDWRLVAYHIVQ